MFCMTVVPMFCDPRLSRFGPQPIRYVVNHLRIECLPNVFIDKSDLFVRLYGVCSSRRANVEA